MASHIVRVCVAILVGTSLWAMLMLLGHVGLWGHFSGPHCVKEYFQVIFTQTDNLCNGYGYSKEIADCIMSGAHKISYTFTCVGTLS